MTDSWKDRQFSEEYMKNATDTEKNWYEHYVNAASLRTLIPKGVASLLDFGCGPGEFTAQLKEKGYEVDGCDGSEAMIELAREHYQDIDFFVWDGSSSPAPAKSYDAVVTKLTLHFIEDLNSLARNLILRLNPNGSLLVSVPHPMPTISKAGTYLEQVHYDTEIGSYGMHVTMIHRSVQDYIQPFLDNGFVMTGIVEPFIPQEIIERFSVKEEYAEVPRRLNLRFKKG